MLRWLVRAPSSVATLPLRVPLAPKQSAAPVLRGGGSLALADRRSVLQAALAPERVETALELQGRLRPDTTLVDVAVVPDLLDDLVGPVGLQAEQLAHVVLLVDAENALHLRVGGALHLVDILAAD